MNCRTPVGAGTGSTTSMDCPITKAFTSWVLNRFMLQMSSTWSGVGGKGCRNHGLRHCVTSASFSINTSDSLDSEWPWLHPYLEICDPTSFAPLRYTKTTDHQVGCSHISWAWHSIGYSQVELWRNSWKMAQSLAGFCNCQLMVVSAGGQPDPVAEAGGWHPAEPGGLHCHHTRFWCVHTRCDASRAVM